MPFCLLAMCYKRRWPVALLPAQKCHQGTCTLISVGSHPMSVYTLSKYHNTYTCLLPLSKLFWNINAQQIVIVFPTNTTLPCKLLYSGLKCTYKHVWSTVGLSIHRETALQTKTIHNVARTQVYGQRQPYGYELQSVNKIVINLATCQQTIVQPCWRRSVHQNQQNWFATFDVTTPMKWHMYMYTQIRNTSIVYTCTYTARVHNTVRSRRIYWNNWRRHMSETNSTTLPLPILCSSMLFPSIVYIYMHIHSKGTQHCEKKGILKDSRRRHMSETNSTTLPLPILCSSMLFLTTFCTGK